MPDCFPQGTVRRGVPLSTQNHRGRVCRQVFVQMAPRSRLHRRYRPRNRRLCNVETHPADRAAARRFQYRDRIYPRHGVVSIKSAFIFRNRYLYEVF